MFELMYVAHGGSGLNMHLPEILMLPVLRMEDLYIKLSERRQEEAKNIQSAYRSKKPM